MSDAAPAPPVLEGEVVAPEKPSFRGMQRFVKGDPRINRKGRISGTKNVLGESFLRDLAKWHKLHGWKAIEKVGREKPEKLLEIMASLIPKEAHLDVQHRGGLVLGTIEIQEVERRTNELLARIGNGVDSDPGAN